MDKNITNTRAFLDTIAISELSKKTVENSDNGYNVLVGSLPDMIFTFSSYHRHPNHSVNLGKIKSTAAGRYQIMGWIWEHYKVTLRLKGFWPEDQDTIALQLIKECKAIDSIAKGDIIKAIDLCKSRWASFTGAGYGQNEHSLDYLVSVFKECGGKLI